MRSFLPILILLLAVGCAQVTENDPGDTNGDNRSLVDTDPQTYFEAKLAPLLQKTANCASCHGLPKDGGNGNFRPYQYAFMRNILVTGQVYVSKTTIDNGAMRYMLGQVAGHAGNRAYCTGLLTTTPCKEVREWAKLEGLTVAEVSTGSSGTTPPFGRVSAGENDGTIYGWASESANPTSTVTVDMYIGGPRGSGTLIGTAPANQPYYGAEKTGNVGFRFTLPDMYRDGTSRTVYLYGRDVTTAGVFHELTDSPITTVAYVPDPVAKSYYNANVIPYVNNNCVGCHSAAEFNYDYAFYALLMRPTAPHNGATSTSNTFYRKMFGSESHRGGARCNGNPANAPCNFLINTWNMEFN